MLQIATMKTNEILNQAYMNAKDLMIVIPNLTYDNAIKYINEVREEMKQKNLCIPITKPKVALTKLIKKKFGI